MCGWLLGWLTVGINPSHSVWAAVWVQITWSRVWCLLKYPFICATYRVNLVLFWCGLKLSTGYLGSGASWEGLQCSQCQMLTISGPGLPIWSYKAIHSFWLLLLGWVCVEGSKVGIKAGFYQHWAWEQVSKRPKAPQDSLLPASAWWLSVRLSHWKILFQYTIIWDRFSVSHQVPGLIIVMWCR